MPDLVAILQENVVERIKMEGIAVGQCAVHIEEHCLDCAQIGKRSVSRVGAHCDASNLDGLCGTTIARHGDDDRLGNSNAIPRLSRLQCSGHVTSRGSEAAHQGILTAAYSGIADMLTVLLRNRLCGGGLHCSRRTRCCLRRLPPCNLLCPWPCCARFECRINGGVLQAFKFLQILP